MGGTLTGAGLDGVDLEQEDEDADEVRHVAGEPEGVHLAGLPGMGITTLPSSIRALRLPLPPASRVWVSRRPPADPRRARGIPGKVDEERRRAEWGRRREVPRGDGRIALASSQPSDEILCRPLDGVGACANFECKSIHI